MIPRSDDRHQVPAATVKLSDSFSHASDAGDKSLILQGNISDRGDFRQTPVPKNVSRKQNPEKTKT